MATAEEILETMEEEATSEVIVVNNDLRTLTIPESIVILGVENDDDVVSLPFRMPRHFKEIDLGEFALRINYMNANGEADVYPVTDKTVGDEYIDFSWLVGKPAVKYKGKTKFVVCARLLGENDVKKEFNTTTASLPVLEGLEASSAVAQQNPDIIENILLRLNKLEVGGGSGGAGIDDETPSTETTYSSSKINALLNEQKEANDAQDEEIAKRAKDDDLAAVAKSGSYNDLSNKPTIPTVPESLKNPNALTFTGAVNETYDGSAPKSVAIPTVPESLKNPHPLTINGQSYDGSEEVNVTVEGDSSEYTLPVATETTLGGVKGVAKTDKMTQEIGVDENGKMWGEPGGGTSVWGNETLAEGTIPSETAQYTFIDTGLSLTNIMDEWDAFCVKIFSAESNGWQICGNNTNQSDIADSRTNTNYVMYGFQVVSGDRRVLRPYKYTQGATEGYYTDSLFDMTNGATSYSASLSVGFKKVENYWNKLYIRNWAKATTSDAKWKAIGVIRRKAQ